MSRWGPPAVVVAIVAVAVAALIAVAGGDKRDLAFATDISPSQLGAVVQPGATACERRVHVDGRFDVLRLAVATIPPAPEAAIAITRSGGGRVLATGRIPAGFTTSRRLAYPATRLSRAVDPGRYVDICIGVRGRSPLFIAGHSATPAHAVLLAHGGEKRLRTDLHFDFITTRPRSALSQLPALFHRAALFRAGPVGAWTYWALLAIVLLAVPALLVRALWTARVDTPERDAAPMR